MTDRLDDLLDQFLDTGEMPVDTTPEERAELERMARAAGLFTATRDAVDAEARSTMPTARARFERHIAANQPRSVPAPVRAPVSKPKRSWLSSLLVAHRIAGAGVTAAVIGVVAIVALFATQNASNNTESAAALVLEPGDYAQVQGVVENVAEENGVKVVTITSEFGALRIALSESTSIIETGGLGDLASISKGQALLIAGLVNNDRTIAAQTLALAAATESGTATASDLKRTPPPEFTGVLTLVAVSKDSGGGRVVIATPNGRYTVRVDNRSAAALFTGSDRLIGATVEARHAPSDAFNVFVVSMVSPPVAGATPPPANSGFVRVTGVLTARSLNVLTVETDRGPATVAIRDDTTILLGDSGLTIAEVLRGQRLIGHTITVTGGIQRATGRVIADLIVVGPQAP